MCHLLAVVSDGGGAENEIKLNQVKVEIKVYVWKHSTSGKEDSIESDYIILKIIDKKPVISAPIQKRD